MLLGMPSAAANLLGSQAAPVRKSKARTVRGTLLNCGLLFSCNRLQMQDPKGTDVNQRTIASLRSSLAAWPRTSVATGRKVRMLMPVEASQRLAVPCITLPVLPQAVLNQIVCDAASPSSYCAMLCPASVQAGEKRKRYRSTTYHPCRLAFAQGVVQGLTNCPLALMCNTPQ
jgi:hypothetical protein